MGFLGGLSSLLVPCQGGKSRVPTVWAVLACPLAPAPCSSRLLTEGRLAGEIPTTSHTYPGTWLSCWIQSAGSQPGTGSPSTHLTSLTLSLLAAPARARESCNQALSGCTRQLQRFSGILAGVQNMQSIGIWYVTQTAARSKTRLLQILQNAKHWVLMHSDEMAALHSFESLMMMHYNSWEGSKSKSNKSWYLEIILV